MTQSPTQAPATLGLLLLLTAAPAVAANVEKLGLAPHVEVSGKRLVLNGAAVQKKLFWDIYAVALYLESPGQDAHVVVSSDQVKRIHLRLLRDASKTQLQGALRDGFRKSISDVGPVAERLERLLAAIPDVRKGDDILITYVPGQGTSLEGQGCQPVLLPGKDFADAMFSLWLGSDPGTQRIKRQLLGR